MKITKEFTIAAKKHGKMLIISDLQTLCMVLGTTSVSGNMHMYKGLEKKGTKWYLPMHIINDRIDFIQTRVDRDLSRIEIMKQVVKK